MDTVALREQALAAYQQGPEAVVSLVTGLVAALTDALASVSARLTSPEAAAATLRAGLSTDRHHRSQPPSSDGPGRTPHPQSLRRPSGRKPGGQPGHPGHPLRLVEEPDAITVHTPPCCQACGQSLAQVPAQRRARRQVVDLPPLQVQVTEHQAETECCPGCGTPTTAVFPAGVTAPVQYGPGVAALAVYLNQAQLLPLGRTAELLAERCGCPLSERTLEAAVLACHAQLADVEAAIKQGVTAAAVAHVDETGLKVGGKTAWLHVASTARLTFYGAHPNRGQAALEALGVLPAFRGRAVQDGWSSYWQYPACAHALCNAHHLRELPFVAEQLGQAWAQERQALRLAIKQAVDAARAQGQRALLAAVQQAFAVRYDALLAAGHQANPPPMPTGKRGRPKLGKAGRLVARLETHKAATLAFMTDFTVPFDNNLAERDIRMTKLQQKVSGGFRTRPGAERFCRIRRYIATLRKQGLPVLAALQQAMVGAPPLPVTT